MADLIQKFNKVTKEIKKKEDAPAVKICSSCKKPATDWIQSVTYDTGVLLENRVQCEKCRQKALKKKQRKSKQ